MLEIVPTTAAEAEAVTRFLLTAFDMRPGAPFVEPGLMRWKYYEPHPGFQGARSFVLRADGEIAAHAAVCPSRYVAGGREISSMYVIDWAASPRVPGAGYLLLREVEKLAETRFGIGGTDVARAVSKRTLVQQGWLEIYGRVVRPWSRFLNHPVKDWKSPLRMARDMARAAVAPPLAPGEWSATPVDQFSESAVAPFPSAHRTFSPFKRTAAELNYVLRCPAVKMSGLLLERRSEVRGYCVLARVGRQARIAGLYVDSDSPLDWTDAYRTAARSAAALPGVHEIVAAASTDLERAAVTANGFRLRQRNPIWLSDPSGLFAGQPPAHVTLLEADGAFLYDPANP